MKASRIICLYNYHNLLTPILKVFSMFYVILDHKEKNTKHNLVCVRTKCWNCRNHVHFKLDSKKTKEKYVFLKLLYLSMLVFLGWSNKKTKHNINARWCVLIGLKMDPGVMSPSVQESVVLHLILLCDSNTRYALTGMRYWCTWQVS